MQVKGQGWEQQQSQVKAKKQQHKEGARATCPFASSATCGQARGKRQNKAEANPRGEEEKQTKARQYLFELLVLHVLLLCR